MTLNHTPFRVEIHPSLTHTHTHTQIHTHMRITWQQQD